MSIPDPCTPDSKLSYIVRAIIYDLWNYEHDETYGMIEGDIFDEFIVEERNKLTAGWNKYLAEHGSQALRENVSFVYDTPEAQDAIARYHART